VIFNEPWVFTIMGYLNGHHAPGIREPSMAMRATHIVNLAQGMAARAMRETGKVDELGTAFSMSGAYPASNSQADKDAAERRFAFANLWFLEPMQNGRYPDAYVGGTDLERLGVEPGDMEIVKAPADFIGINLYTGGVFEHDSQEPNLGVRQARSDVSERTDFGWEVRPEALHDVIMRIWDDYGLPIYVTENGASYNDVPNEDGAVEDERRVSFLQRYLAQVARAIDDGADVRGYYLWSLMDNFEWAFGYDQRFGITHVDFETLERTIKQSGFWYRDVIVNNGFSY
jgi:beta-glucosidase